MIPVVFDPSVDIRVTPPSPLHVERAAALCDTSADELEGVYLPAVTASLTVSRANRGAGHGLFNRRGVAPTAERIRLVHLLAAFAARDLGLYLPVEIVVRHVAAGPEDPRGSALADGEHFAIALAASVPDDDVPALMFHELQHVADFLVGGHDLVEREARAVRFAWNAARAWSEASEVGW